MSTLQNQLAATEREEVACAIRTLLGKPLLRREAEPEAYELVRRRRVAVAAWFDAFLGWPLELHPRSGHVRLVKIAAPSFVEDDLRPARRSPSGPPFDRLRYILLCVVSAELVRRRNVALGELAESAVHAASVDPELPRFEPGRHAHRRAFVDAVLLLEDLGALISVEGRTESFTKDERTSVLYRVEPSVLFGLLAAPGGASRVPVAPTGEAWFGEAVDGILEEPGYGPDYRELTLGTSQQDPFADDVAALRPRRNLWLRHSALRAAFEDPALHRDRLSHAQRGYLDSISGRDQLRRAADTAGFILESRAEGYLLVDPDRISTDEVFPGEGAVAIAALHLIAVLVRQDRHSCSEESLRTAVAELLGRNQGWARTYQDDDGPQRLYAEAVALLGRHHLVTKAPDRITARPAAHRYRAASLEGVPHRPRHRRRAPADAQAVLIDAGDGGSLG